MKTNLHQLADFTNKNIFVGIDVHQESWNVSLFYERDFLRTFTQPPSPESLGKYLKKEYPRANYLCGYEAGFCGFWIQRQLEQRGIACYVLHAADIPQSGKHKILKRDSIDSKSIGLALANGSINSIYIPDPEIEKDRSLVRFRGRLQKDISRCKNRIRSMLCQYGLDVPERFSKCWSKKFIQWLKELDQVEGAARTTLNHMIEQMELLRNTFLKVNHDIRELQKDEKYKDKMQWLLSIPGIGPLTAITLITELINIHRFSSFRHLNSFVGLYPMEHSSGEDEHKGSITIRHNKQLRHMMIEAAWIAIRHDPALTLSFVQWKQRMTGKRAIVKIARKLLSRIRYVLINETMYEKGIIK